MRGTTHPVPSDITSRLDCVLGLRALELDGRLTLKLLVISLNFLHLLGEIGPDCSGRRAHIRSEGKVFGPSDFGEESIT